MSTLNCVSSQDLEIIFGRISEITSLSEDFLNILRERQAFYPNLVIERIGDVIKSRLEEFLCYGRYIGDLSAAKYHLHLISKKSEVASLLKDALTKEECRRLDLLNFLDQPRRRLAKISCLVHEIDKCTHEEHPDK